MPQIRCPIVGTQHHGEAALNKLDALPAQTPIVLKRDRNNRFDARAVACYADDQHVGFLPKTHNELPSRLMDSGNKITAVLVERGELVINVKSGKRFDPLPRIVLTWED